MGDVTFPVMNVKMVPTEKVVGNDYNPNKVAPPEMQLLRHSIEQDGYTQPIVVYYDKEDDIYVVVDGFHRLRCAKEYFSLKEVPVVEINKPLENRMASTIRHNRARGKHGVTAMSDIVLELSRRNWTDKKIAKELGMEPDEVLRMKQITGLAELFSDREFSMSWE